MDTQPSEVIRRIASFLNPRDVIAMRMTNKNMKWKLDRYRRVLPKPLVDVKIEDHARFSLEVSLPAKGWTWKSVLVESATGEPETESTKDKRMDQLADFYTSRKDRIQKMTRGHFGWGLLGGLSLHLHFILNHMRIRTLSLHFETAGGSEMDYDSCDIIQQMMKAYGAEVKELRFHWDMYHMGLIETCKPTSLFLQPGDMFTDFFESSTVQKIPNLVMSPGQVYDDEMLRFSARVLELDFWGWPYITVGGIIQFIKQWVEGEREIEWVVFKCGQDGFCSNEEWADRLTSLDENLVVVTVVDDNGFVTMRRLSDGVSLHSRFVLYCAQLELLDVEF